MADLLRVVTYAIRRLRHAPGFTIVAGWVREVRLVCCVRT